MGNLLSALPGAVSLGLVWGIMAIGLGITYKILAISDLTVDGSFATGGAVAVMLILNGCNLWLSFLLVQMMTMYSIILSRTLNIRWK